jgi:hypothetical protein
VASPIRIHKLWALNNAMLFITVANASRTHAPRGVTRTTRCCRVALSGLRKWLVWPTSALLEGAAKTQYLH